MCIVKQHDITDCGPACLSSIISYYGGYVPIEIIRLKCETNYMGTTAYNLIEAAKSYNLSARGIKVEKISDIKNYTLPCIVHLKLKNSLNHFAVLYEIKNCYVILMDPSLGRVKMTINEFEEIFTNVIIQIKPQSTLVCYQKPNSIKKLLLSILKNNKTCTLRLLFSSILIVIISVITSYFIKYGSFAASGDFGLTVLIYLIMIYFVIYLIKNVIDYIKNKLIVEMNKNISVDLYEKFSHQLYILPLNFIKSKTSGEIISRYSELSQINQMLPDIIISISLDLIMALVAIIFSSFISFNLVIISTLFMIIYFFISFALKNPTLQRINKNITLSSEFNSEIIDNVNTIISTKYMNNEDNMEKRLERKGVYYLKNNMDLESFFNKCNFLKNIVYDLARWSILSCGLYLCFIQKISIIDLFTFEIVINYFFEPIKDIINMIPKLCYIKSSLFKLSEFSIIKEEEKGTFCFKPGKININKLCFSYNDYEKIINDFSLEIKEKEKILIQGKSGSGKSTLCQLLSKQLDYKIGEIKIADININDIKTSDLRKNITYIGQKDSLLVDTILKNITFERKVLDKNLKTICNICEIDEIINKKIDRYNTLINESQMNISGGEKQRIILARGLINPGSIIILDEALSEVNKDMEERIIKRIFNYFKNKTIIYVSHKDYNNLFDRKVVLNN